MLSMCLQYLINILLGCTLCCVGLYFTLPYLLQWKTKRSHPEIYENVKPGEKIHTVGFFHPYCNAGGGGERVLWVAIRAIQNKYPSLQCVVYSGDTDVTGEQILLKAKQRFNIALKKPVKFIFLNKRNWVEAYKYPYFTLLGQSLGSMLLAAEAMWKFVPDLFIDTMGYAFTFPLFRYFGGSRVSCYVHYPTISTDMLQQVSNRTESYNNASFISRSPVLSYLKLTYYKIFAFLYKQAGRCSELTLVNSSWTNGHILALWQAGERTHVVYPPCDINTFINLPSESGKDSHGKHSIVSVAQFRPEKNHALQLKSFHKFLTNLSNSDRNNFTLKLVGSCRNEEDSGRVDELRKLCDELQLNDNVEFKLNVSFEELKALLSSATIGLHTMWNEHFGIGVVEIMAAGAVVLAHNSGGPKMDIVVDYNGFKTGFLAQDVDSYATAMETIFNMSQSERSEIIKNARESVRRFSDEQFDEDFLTATEMFFS